MARSFDGSVAILRLKKSQREDLDYFARIVRLAGYTRKERAERFGFSMYKMRLIESGRYLAPDLFDLYVEVGAPIPGWLISRYYENSALKARHEP